MAVRDTWQRLEDLDKMYEHALRIMRQQDSRIARLEHRIREALRREDAPKAQEPEPSAQVVATKRPPLDPAKVALCSQTLAPRIDAWIKKWNAYPYRPDDKPMLVVGALEPTPATTIVAVSDITGVPWEDILSRARTARVNVGRRLAEWMLRELTSMSYPMIGALMERDHSSVLHNYDLVEKQMEREPQYRKTVISLMEHIKGLAQRKYDGSNTIGGGEGPHTGELPHAGGTGNAGPGAAAA